jgi:heavy metal sensor kinase
VTLTLRTRLTVVYTSVFGLLLTAISLVSYEVLARQLDRDATASLGELTSGLHGYLKFESGTPTVSYDPVDADEAAFVQEATRYYQIFDADSGQLIVQSEAIEPLGLHFTPGEIQALPNRQPFEDIRTDYGRIRLSNSIINAGGHTYLLQVGASLDATDRVLERFLVLLLWSVPAGMLAAVAAGRWMTRLSLAPLLRLADETRAIGIRDLQRRVTVRGTRDELDDVAMALNDTLARLEHAIGEMRQFSTALAHELRTPLAALRGEIELASLRLDQAASEGTASQLEEIDKLTRLIDQLLTLARAEAGDIQTARAPVDLGALTASVLDQLELVAQDQGILLTAELSGRIVVRGDAQWLERMLLNLVDNALKFTPPGGRVIVRLGREEQAVVMRVIDTGAGIPSDVLPHVFERFFQADPARSSAASRSRGAGLGLSLVKWIVDRHQGTIAVESRPGQGSTFTVRLPLDLA